MTKKGKRIARGGNRKKRDLDVLHCKFPLVQPLQYLISGFTFSVTLTITYTIEFTFKFTITFTIATTLKFTIRFTI